MSIAITCTKCNGSFKVKDEFAGKRGKCPKCQEMLLVPSPTASKASTSIDAIGQAFPTSKIATTDEIPPEKNQAVASLDPAKIQKELLAAFQGRIEPIRTTWTYRIGLVLVGFVVMLLPFVYVGLIGLVVYGIYLHAVYDLWWFGITTNHRAWVIIAIAYGGILFAGGVLVLFMIKPLFARPSRIDRRRSLTRKGEPVLFSFVDRVCESLGVSPPKRIDVNCEVNASASFDGGLLSTMVRNDLVLTIGMPLVTGMNIQQFAEVLGHEFGHFRQGFAMRMTYMIRTINHWFTRVVYERDQWDDQLSQWAEVEDYRLALVVGLATLFVLISRKILWVLMVFGHAVAGYMMRQMEYDADRHAVRLVGSDVLEENSRILMRLGVAYQGALVDLQQFYNDGCMGDDLPRLIMYNMQQFPEDVHRKLDQLVDESRTGLLDTHPSDADRIRHARCENAEGIFHADYPASILFCHFDSLCKNTTWDFYRSVLGSHIKPTDLHPLAKLLEKSSSEQ